MKTLYKGSSAEGRTIESFNINDIPSDWEITEQEIEDPNIINAESEIEVLRAKTRSEISSLIFEHTQKLMMRGVSIPDEIQEEYDLKRNNYKLEKEAIYQKYGISNNP